MFSCNDCETKCTKKLYLRRHIVNVHLNIGKIHCISCKKYFRSDNYKIHEKVCRGKAAASLKKNHPNTAAIPSTSKAAVDLNTSPPPPKRQKFCDFCNVHVEIRQWGGHQRTLKHKNNVAHQTPNERVKIIKSAFKDRIAVYRITAASSFLVVSDFMDAIRTDVDTVADQVKREYYNFKFNFELFALCSKPTVENSAEVKSFATKNITYCSESNEDDNGNDFSSCYDVFKHAIITKSEEFQESGSGWSLECIQFLEINFSKYDPLRGGSYLSLPEWIKLKKAVINVKNDDDKCFAWAVVSALYPVQKNADRVSSYPQYDKVGVNFDGIGFPVMLSDIGKFERVNPKISVNVLGIKEEKIVGPLYRTKNKAADHEIDLLLVQDDNFNSHYCWIKNLSRLLSSQINSREHKKFLCRHCFINFPTEEKLKLHQKHDCNHVCTILPSEHESYVHFHKKNFKKQLEVPFVIYADFEASFKNYATCSLDPKILAEKSYTENVSKHKPFSFACKVKCRNNDKLDSFHIYRGRDCVKKFWEYIVDQTNRIYRHLKTKKMLPLSVEEMSSFTSATECHICKQGLLDDDKVKDHDHYTGEFRGAAHSDCNINMQRAKFIPVIFHNLSNYDAHFIIPGIDYDKERVEVIPNSKEKYISFTKHVKIWNRDSKKECTVKVRFLDSRRFMNASLDELVKNLEPNQMSNMKARFPDDDEFQLLKEKGVFPYEYIDGRNKLKEQSIPPQDVFYSKLKDKGISKEEYTRVQQIWQKFKCKTLGEYSDLYLETDVLLLTDVFENFRTVCLKTYQLDPAQYYTSPGLSWDAMLKHTGIRLDLFTDIDMMCFIKKGIRGGLAQCVKRKATANNKYIENYDKSKPSNYLVYLDANNLYGAAMSQYLPYGEFKWIGPNELDSDNIHDLSDDSDTGYILEVDLKYSNELHDEHADFPFCPRNIIPQASKSKQSKLIADVCDKTNYIIHYRNLKQCLQNGLTLVKVHRILQFKQSDWLKSYIDLNTNKRMLATNQFEKDFFKLMNNAVFGKTMENVDKRVDVKLITHWDNIGKRRGARHFVNLPQFHSCDIFNETLVAIQLTRVKIKYDKPIYVGFAVLDLSKTVMYDFHYSYIKKKYGDDADLLYTDTDSLFYDIRTHDVYEDMRLDLPQWFDTSDYPIDNIYGYPRVNKKVIGKFKDEFKGEIVTSYIGLKSKTYCISVGDKVQVKNKGVSKSVDITPDDFQNVLHSRETIHKPMYIFKSCKHEIHTQLINKVALSFSDDKRYIIKNSEKTLPWGHYKIPE
ncbi:uncharacterized protein LOC135839514 [Planococcus citri]|uniref:uncharacterized protein LOC135839514 n=1 Tax=Planococcus citri TaxID=170843 RepID=UPI0031F89339